MLSNQGETLNFISIYVRGERPLVRDYQSISVRNARNDQIMVRVPSKPTVHRNISVDRSDFLNSSRTAMHLDYYWKRRYSPITNHPRLQIDRPYSSSIRPTTRCCYNNRKNLNPSQSRTKGLASQRTYIHLLLVRGGSHVDPESGALECQCERQCGEVVWRSVCWDVSCHGL